MDGSLRPTQRAIALHSTVTFSDRSAMEFKEYWMRIKMASSVLRCQDRLTSHLSSIMWLTTATISCKGCRNTISSIRSCSSWRTAPSWTCNRLLIRLSTPLDCLFRSLLSAWVGLTSQPWSSLMQTRHHYTPRRRAHMPPGTSRNSCHTWNLARILPA